MKRQLISCEQAIPAKGQHKKPCSDCPWARTALNGWLGGVSIEKWLADARSDSSVECHTLQGAQCAGMAIDRANTAKLSRDSEVLRLPANQKTVFATPIEFAEHHKKGPKLVSIVKENMEEIEGLINEVEGDTKNVSRAEYREFLEELKGLIAMRLEVLEDD